MSNIGNWMDHYETRTIEEMTAAKTALEQILKDPMFNNNYKTEFKTYILIIENELSIRK